MTTALARRAFLRRLGLLGIGGALVPLAAACGDGDGPSEAGDPGALNLLLTIEHIAADLYRRGLEGDLLSGRDRALLEAVAQHESDHVELLRMAVEDLGGIAVGKPDLSYPEGLFGEADRFLGRARRLEELGVAAYQGQLATIERSEILETVASIAGTESRHAAVLARLAGAGPFPATTERGQSEGAVRDAVDAFVEG